MDDFFGLNANVKSAVYSPSIINSNEYFTNCAECGSTYVKKDLNNIDLIIEGKGKYPDVLLSGSWPLLIVSDKLLNIWEDNKITGFNSYPIKIFTKNGAEILKNDAHYYNIKITGKCQLDFKAMGIEILEECKTCGAVIFNKEVWEFGTPIVKTNSWDGSDLFVADQFESAPLCTLTIIKLIEKYNIINFSMKRFEDFFDYCADEVSIKEILK